MRRLFAVLACVALASTRAHTSNPIQQALEMISNMQAKLLSQATEAQATYSRYTAFCEERARNLNYAIKTEKAEVGSLKATILTKTSSVETYNSKIDELVSEINTNEEELNKASALRKQEATHFADEQKELKDIIYSLELAISKLSKEDGAALIQTSNPSSVTEALRVLVDASSMNALDVHKLSDLVQVHDEGGDAEDTHMEDAAIDSWTADNLQQPPSFLQQLPATQASNVQSAPPPPGLVPVSPDDDMNIEPPPPTDAAAAAASAQEAADTAASAAAAAASAAAAAGALQQSQPLGHPPQEMHYMHGSGTDYDTSPSPAAQEASYEVDDHMHWEPPPPEPTHEEITGSWSFPPSPSMYSSAMLPEPSALPLPSRPPPQIPEPKAAVYQGKSSGILATLESLLEKARAHLDKLQNSEGTARHNYEMLRSSLAQGKDATEKELTATKASLPEASEDKAVAEGDLEVTSEDLAGDSTAKEALRHDCLNTAKEFQMTMLSRNREVKALAAARKAIEDTTGHAAAQTYLVEESGATFVQRLLQKNHPSPEAIKSQTVRLVRDLAKKLDSRALAQLASQMTSALQLDSGTDPAAKVKELIRNVIMQLESDADNDATLKEYCDKELAASAEKDDDTNMQRDSLHVQIEQKRARSNKLRNEISTLQQELSDLAKAQSVAAQIRQDEHDTFLKNKAEMEQGLNGIKLALKVLKEHYGQDANSNLLTDGASGGIIGLLEVVESDFSKNLAEMVVAEEQAASYYKSAVKPSSELESAAKQKDQRFKTKEYASVNKKSSELSTDATHVAAKLEAMSQYDKLLRAKCAKADVYAERKSRREREIEGLKEALKSLEGDAVLLQMKSAHHLRGAGHRTL